MFRRASSINLFILMIIFISTVSCQKDLKLKFDKGAIKQVIIANFTPNTFLKVSVSKSKQPDDYNPVEFLSTCKVDLYENGVFIETMPFILKDTLSGLGFYTSGYKLKQNKTYKVTSEHEQLGVALTEEYLPPYPSNVSITLLQHADTLNPNKRGKYMLSFQDSANAKNYYFISVYYKGRRIEIDSLGNTNYKTDYLYNVPSYTAEIPNTINYYKSFFTDANYDGQLKTYVFDISSQYDNNFISLYNYYVEIYLEAEFSNVGPGYYQWYLQQLPKSDNTFNDGQNERINFTSNIINGYGHFSAYSSVFKSIRIK